MCFKIETPLTEKLYIEESSTKDINSKDGFVFDLSKLGAEEISVLESILNCSVEPTIAEGVLNKVSVKFMITKQDETNLLSLGYSTSQIDTMKPQEAADIIHAGTNSESVNSLE